MALAPINPTNLTPPRVEFIDPRTGAISREWYRFFLSLLTATQATQEEVTLGTDTASLLATYDAMLATATQATEVTSDGMVASLESSLNNLQNAFGVTPPDLGGTVTSVAASGGTTGLTFTGSPITTSGTLTLGGTLAVANGGTGQTSYTNGQLLIGNTTGNTLTPATLTAGTNISITNGAGAITINASDSFTGTVTSVSVVSANGFAGTVATATTTPAITLSTSVTGLIKGNGTALSAAVAATDYVAPSAYASANGLTMSTSRLLGRTTASTGAAEEISVAGGLTLSAGVLTGTSGTVTSVTGTSPVVSSGGTTPAISMPAATTSVNGYLTSTDWTTFNNKGSGTVTSVTGTSPVVSSGGTTPAISMPAATTSVNGYLTSTDWTTFNNKGSGTVTSVSGTGTVNGITLTGTVTSTGSLTLGGTLSGVSLTTQVSGTLPIANGGTNGTSTPTAGAVPYGTGTAYAFTAAGTSGQVLTSAGAGVPTWTTPTTGTVTSVTGTAPVVSSGGATPAISMAAATTSVNGYLTSTDWNTFNGKQATLVSGTNIKTVGGVSLLGSGDVGTIGATYGGTGQSSYAVGDILYASTTTALSKLADVATGNAIISGGVGVAPSYGKIGLTTHISGTLAVANGGTGATTLTSGYLLKGNGTSAVSASVVYDDGTNIGIGTNSPADLLQIYRSSGSGITSGISLSTAAGGVGDGSYIKWLSAVTAEKVARIDGVLEGTDVGSLRFNTGNGADGFAERMRLDASGNLGIGTTANASAILDAQSTTKGFRLPNMTTVQKNAIASPAAGLMVFDTTLAKACVYSGAAWQTITSI